MAITEEELTTNKVISQPPKPIPFVDAEEILFVQLNIVLGIVVLLLIGVIQNILRSNGMPPIPEMFMRTFMIFIFIIFPVVSITIMKIIKIGKPLGFLEQKMIIYFKTSLLNKNDFRDKEERKNLHSLNNIFKIINNKEWWKNRKPINGTKPEQYFNQQEDYTLFKDKTDLRFKKLRAFYDIQKKEKESENREIEAQLKIYYSTQKD